MPSELGITGPATATYEVRRAERSEVVCRQVRSAGERADHLAIRHRVFVEEQDLFSPTDMDVHDWDGSTIALLGYSDGVVAGTVRLYLLDPAAGIWQGDRLGVLEPYRSLGVGAPLVRCAVATAASLGGRSMSAHIQPANVKFFLRLGWSTVGDTEIYAGVIHQPMSIVLPSRSEGRVTVRRLAAGINARDL
ncbi:MAG TPA: MSMEG_0567/Sll0786 family nitrogen starvation N-acetyltransferase [Jiangellaceae bacterium]